MSGCDTSACATIGVNGGPSGAVPPPTASSLAASAQPVTVPETGQPLFVDVLGYTLPGGTLPTDGAIRVTLAGTYVNNSGASRVYTVQIQLGGTTLYEAVSAGNGASALLTTWRCEFQINAQSQTQVHLNGFFYQSPTNVVTTGLGALNNIARVSMDINTATGGVAVGDLASNRLIAFSLQHPTNTATQTFVRNSYTVELLSP